MPYFQTSQEWLHQSTLLFQAYPTSSRVTTKYTIHPAQPPNQRKRKRQADNNATGETTTTQTGESAQAAAPAAPKATLTLKTFDPVSGVCLKYRTDKGAEVGRLIGSLGKLGKYMAARPDADAVEEPEAAIGGSGEAVARDDDAAGAVESTGASQSKPAAGAGTAGAGGGGAGGGGGGKKKKKGKK